MRVLPSLCLLLGSTLLTSTDASKVIRASMEKTSRKELESKSNLPQSVGPAVTFLATKPELEMRNHFDYVYLSTVKVGTNEAPFDVILDTGSSTFWIPHVQLAKNHTHTYQCSLSTTCREEVARKETIKYGEGGMEGYVAHDKLKIGDAVIDDFQFLVATKTEFKNSKQLDGIVGLSPANGRGNAPTVLKRMKDANLIDNMQFSMYLGSQTYARGSATGEIIFGGWDSKYMREGEEFKYIKIDQQFPQHWTTHLAGIGMGTNVNISEGSTKIIIDSGTSLIYLPDSYVTNIMREAQKKGIKFGWNKEHDAYACDCKARTILDPLFIYFENLTLSVPATSYIESNANKCFLAIKSSHSVDDNILGDVFLKHYYTVYDLDNWLVGFAAAAPVSMWKNWVLAAVIFGSMGLVWLIIHLVLREKKAVSSVSSGNSRSNTSGGGISSLFSRNQNQGVAIGGSSANNPRSRLLDNQQELH